MTSTNVKVVLIVTGGLVVLGVALLAAYSSVASWYNIDPLAVPGTYVWQGHGSRHDTIVLHEDGTFARTARFAGIEQVQQGRWRQYVERGERPRQIVELDELSPTCLKRTEPEGTFFHWGDANDVVCGDIGVSADFCRMRSGKPDLCFIEREYTRQ